MTVGIVGMGYVGLPLAVAFAEAGSPVIGVDVVAERIESLRAGRSHIEDVSDDSVDLDTALAAADLAVIVTAHSEVDHERVAREAARVLDLRGVTRGRNSDTVERL